jgi:glycosyltransferase involved in cell wall biosynthesis
MEDGPYRHVLEDLGVDVRIVERKFRLDVTAALRMWRVASESAPDIVHAWGWMSTLAMAPYCRIHGIPLLNGTIQFGALPPRGGRMFRLGMKVSDVIVANSGAGLACFGLAEGGRNRVVYNGFDAARMAAVPKDAEQGAGRVGMQAIMAARMYPAKDWHVLLAAARVLEQDDTGWQIVAMGDGPIRDTLMHDAADLIASGAVAFPPGALEALPAIAEADVGVLLTDPDENAAEGCSNSIVEYMACGLPVVCTDSGGNPELVEDGVTGFLVPPKDVGAVVSALRALGDDPELARQMGREGRRRMQQRFAVSTMVAGFTEIYTGLLAGSDGKKRP